MPPDLPNQASSHPAPGTFPRSSATGVLLVVAVGLILFAIRALEPPDVADEYHQERAAAYVMDALRHGHWICQYGAEGEVSSKPPLYTWLAALASLPFGRVHWFCLLLPSALATIGSALLIQAAGRKWFGATAGLLAALAYLVSPIGIKQVVLARIDPLFAFTVLLGALLAFRAWANGRGWTFFWLAAAASTLAKGPLGLVLGAIGLAAVWWERKESVRAPIRGPQLPGVILFLAITGGWLALAYSSIGPPLVQTMLGNELVKHTVGGRDNEVPFREFYKPTLWFLSRFLPWSVLTLVGLWRVRRYPAAIDGARRFERFLFCSLVGGLFLFSLAAHQRPDLIFPLIPAAALLAGRELDRLIARVRLETIRLAIPAVAAVALALVAVRQFAFPRHDSNARRSEVVRAAAEFVRSRVGEDFPLAYLDAPYGFQFCLNSKLPYISEARARELLAGDTPAFVVTGQPHPWPGVSPLYEILNQPMVRSERLQILANVPELKWTHRIATYVGPIQVSAEQINGFDWSQGELRFRRAGPGAFVTLANESPRSERVRVRLQESGPDLREERMMAPGEHWRVGLATPTP